MKNNITSNAALLLLVSLLLFSSLVFSLSNVSYASPQWYYKPSYPDYAPSGMPDFDQRQENWYWRSWAFPDAIAVWEHYDTVNLDWDIYYSIYTDPDMWWTLGTDNARPIVADSNPSMPFFPGDDRNPAISWYSSNYAICVWQHWSTLFGGQWDIWYSIFTPNEGWSTPNAVWGNSNQETDPAIAFDTNGYATAVWIMDVPPWGTWPVFSVWDPNTRSWRGTTNLNGGGFPPGFAAVPEVDVDSQFNVVTIWTDGAPGSDQVYYAWAPSPPPPLGFTPPAPLPACPFMVNQQKGISPDNYGNNLIDFTHTPTPVIGYAEFVSPSKVWSIPATPLPGSAPGEQPDVAFDLVPGSAVEVHKDMVSGQIFYSIWDQNTLTWTWPAFAATAIGGPDEMPALAFIGPDRAIMVWQAYPGGVGEIYYSAYTALPSWTPAATIMPVGTFLSGDDFNADIASPTGSPTTPPTWPPPPPTPANPIWTYSGPTAVANSLWWFDSKYEPNTTPPPTKIDNFPLITNPNVLFDDHDSSNVAEVIQRLAYLMDTDGQRTKLCHQGTTVMDMQAGITHYLSWSGVNPLGDVDGDGEVTILDASKMAAAMGTTPGVPGWNLACDIWPATIGGGTADNIIDSNDANLITLNFGKTGKFYEHTMSPYPSFTDIEQEVSKCQDVVLKLAFYDALNNFVGEHYVTVAGVDPLASQLAICNPIRDDFEDFNTPGRSPVPHIPHPGVYTVHNDAQYVSQDAYTIVLGAGYWYLLGYFAAPGWEARIEYAVVTSPKPRDVAVTNVLARPILNRGDPSYRRLVNVTLQNEGYWEETFNVEVYVQNTTRTISLGIQTVTNLLPGATTILRFPWNTASDWVLSVSCGDYTIIARADIVPDETIADQVDNMKVDGQVTLKLLCDLGSGPPPQFSKFDGNVDGNDLALFIRCYKGLGGSANWLGDLGSGPPPQYFAYDWKVDANDLALFIRCYKGLGP